jgi:hypothetical protein
MRKEIIVNSREEVIAYFEQLNEECGPGWHPDTDFSDMVAVSSGVPAYNEAEALVRNSAMQRAFELYGDAVYDLAAETWQKRGWLPSGSEEDRKSS